MTMTQPSPRPVAGQPSGLPENPARALAGSYSLRVIVFLLAHLPLAYVMESAWPIATAHALLTALVGVVWALLGRTHRAIYVLGYIVGCEVLWRMSEARVFWEYGKYAIVLVAVVALAAEWRRVGGRLRAIAPLLVLVVIVPAVALSVLDQSPSVAFDQISFNLSAYLALGIVGLYLWARPMDRRTTSGLLLALMAPVGGVLFLAMYSTVSQFGVDTFVGASSWVRSGDFGANQVANVLSLGALAGIILLIILPRARAARVLIGLMTIGMIVQGILTFSRGGTYSLILAGLAFGLHLLRTPGARGRFILLMAAFVALVFGAIYPWLNDLSTGAVTARFQDLDTTGRLQLAEADLLAFRDSPLLGVGLGGSTAYHEAMLGDPVGTHTEFTRLLAEHGVFGAMIIALIFWMLLKSYIANRPGLARALSAAMAIWSLSIMAHSATRIVAIPFTLALVLVAWQLEPEPADTEADSLALTTRHDL